MAWAAVIGAGGALLGGALSAKGSKDAAKAASQPQTIKQEIDPRMAAILFGSGQRRLKDGVTPTYEVSEDQFGKPRRTQTNPDSDFTTDGGLLSRYQSFLDQPQSAAMKAFGEASGQFLGDNGMTDMNAMRQASHGLLGGLQAPQSAAPQQIRPDGGQMIWNKGESVNAPSQNSMDLSGSYNSLINGPAGANPFLSGGIQKGINQSNNAFGAMQRDSTQNLLERVMPSIRGGAVIAGGYGGSRQGIAEGRALDSFAKEQQRAISQVSQNNTDAAVAAQAGAYDADRNRQLAATQGLGAQQYGVAQQDAQMRQQANLQNQAIGTDMSKFAAQQGQAAGLANAQLGQQNNQFNAQMQQSANQLNTNRTQSGIAGLSGILGTAYQNAGNQDAYALNRASQVNGLLAPYMSMGGSTTQTTPMYSNTAGSALSGGLMGLQVGQGIASMFNNKPAASSGQFDWIKGGY